MSRIAFTLLPVFALACAAETADSGPGTASDNDAPAAEEPRPDVTTDGYTAERASVSADSEATEAGLLAMNTLASILEDRTTQEFAWTGRLFSDRDADLRCADASIDSGDLVFDYADCESLNGTVRVSREAGATVVTFEDDFTVDGGDLDGEIVADLNLLSTRVDTEGWFIWEEGNTYSVAAGLVLDADSESIGGYGQLGVEAEKGVFTIELGSASDPLLWTRNECACPASGAVASEAAVTVEQVPFDFDWIVDPLDGSDDFPTWWIAVEPTTAAAVMDLTFAETCGGHAVAVEVEDIDVVIPTVELAEMVDDACEAEDIDENTCDTLAIVLWMLGDELPVNVPGEVVSEEAEELIDAAVSAVCN